MERELSRLTIITKDKAQVTMESLYQDLERRIVASPPGLCTICLLYTSDAADEEDSVTLGGRRIIKKKTNIKKKK